MSVTHKNGIFWGLQYHPEYNLYEMARLTWCRRDKLVELGFFKDQESAEDYVSLLELLHKDPNRKDIAWILGIDEDLIDESIRCVEVKNWIEKLVIPVMTQTRVSQ